MKPESIESGVIQAIEALRAELPAAEAQEMLELAKAGEPGIALENLCTQIEEYEIAIAESLFEQIRHLGEAMSLDERYWSGLKQEKGGALNLTERCFSAEASVLNDTAVAASLLASCPRGAGSYASESAAYRRLDGSGPARAMEALGALERRDRCRTTAPTQQWHTDVMYLPALPKEGRIKMLKARDVCGATIWIEAGGPIMLKAVDRNDLIELNAHEARETAKVLLELADVEDSESA